MTRSRTTRIPTAATRATVRITTTTESTTPGRMDEDDYQESSTTPSWPDLIDPVPTFWPTSNWWGSIDPIRNHDDPPGSHRQQQQQQSRHSNRIPTYAPTNIGRTTGSSWSTNNQQARSSSSRPAPYFQLLLAGLVQVRSLVSSGRKLLVVVVVLAAASLILQIRNVSHDRHLSSTPIRFLTAHT